MHRMPPAAGGPQRASPGLDGPRDGAAAGEVGSGQKQGAWGANDPRPGTAQGPGAHAHPPLSDDANNQKQGTRENVHPAAHPVSGSPTGSGRVRLEVCLSLVSPCHPQVRAPSGPSCYRNRPPRRQASLTPNGPPSSASHRVTTVFLPAFHASGG